MKGVLACVWIYFHIIDQRPFVDCCSVQNYGYVDNAFLSCQTSDNCEAQCYRGYIFATGKTKTNYSCQQDRLGIASSCKRNPTVIIGYMAAWEFNNMPTKCGDIFILLNYFEAVLEDVSKLCNTMAVDVNMTSTYSSMAYLMFTTFTGMYYNFTSTSVLESCVALHMDYIGNQTSPLMRSILDDITCFNETLNYTLWNDWQISDRQRHCPNGTEVKTVTVTLSDEDNIEYYCETISLSTDPSMTTGIQNSSNVTTTLAVNDNTPAKYTAIYIAAPIFGIASLIVIMSTVLCYKMRSRANKRQRIYQTISSKNDGQANELTKDSHNYDVIAFRENSSEISRY